MPEYLLTALAHLDAATRAIGSRRDPFAHRTQQGGMTLVDTPGALPSTAAASADARPEQLIVEAAPSLASPVTASK